MMNFGSMLSAAPRRPVSLDEPDMGQQEYGSMLDLGGGQQQAPPPTYGQAFRAGFGQTNGDIRKKLLGGLAGYSGGGGFLGGLGGVAKFMI